MSLFPDPGSRKRAVYTAAHACKQEEGEECPARGGGRVNHHEVSQHENPAKQFMLRMDGKKEKKMF